MANAWIEHVKKYHKKHPQLTYKESLIRASTTYHTKVKKPRSRLYGKGVDAPDFQFGESLLQYKKRTGISDPDTILKKYNEINQKTHNDVMKKFDAEAKDNESDPFVQWYTSKAFKNANNTAVAQSVAGQAVKYINTASKYISPILKDIPGAGTAFNDANKIFNTIVDVIDLPEDQSNQGFANTIAQRTSQARQQALAIRNNLRKTMTPTDFNNFIESYRGKTA
jgi:hypothetical protein